MNTISHFRSVVLVLASFCVFVGCEKKPESKPKAAEPKSSTSIEVIKEGTVLKKLSVDFAEDSTLVEVMELAKTQSKLDFEFTGQGETAFVNSIEGIENQRANGDNWIYRINGKLGSTGVGSVKLKDKDKVTWTFGKYDPNEK